MIFPCKDPYTLRRNSSPFTTPACNVLSGNLTSKSYVSPPPRRMVVLISEIDYWSIWATVISLIMYKDCIGDNEGATQEHFLIVRI